MMYVSILLCQFYGLLLNVKISLTFLSTFQLVYSWQNIFSKLKLIKVNAITTMTQESLLHLALVTTEHKLCKFLIMEA